MNNLLNNSDNNQLKVFKFRWQQNAPRCRRLIIKKHSGNLGL